MTKLKKDSKQTFFNNDQTIEENRFTENNMEQFAATMKSDLKPMLLNPSNNADDDAMSARVINALPLNLERQMSGHSSRPTTKIKSSIENIRGTPMIKSLQVNRNLINQKAFEEAKLTIELDKAKRRRNQTVKTRKSVGLS